MKVRKKAAHHFLMRRRYIGIFLLLRIIFGETEKPIDNITEWRYNNSKKGGGHNAE